MKSLTVLFIAGLVITIPSGLVAGPARSLVTERSEIIVKAAASDSIVIAQSESITPDAMVKFAENAVTKLSDLEDQIEKMTDEAERGDDVSTKNCIRQKQNSIRTASDMAEAQSDDLKSELLAGDMDAAEHSLRLLSILEMRGDSILVEAQACVGEASDVTIDPPVTPPDTPPNVVIPATLFGLGAAVIIESRPSKSPSK